MTSATRRLCAFLLALLVAGCGIEPGGVTELGDRPPYAVIPAPANSLVLHRDGKPYIAPIRLRENSFRSLFEALFREDRGTQLRGVGYRGALELQVPYTRRDPDMRPTTLQVYLDYRGRLGHRALVEIVCTALRNYDDYQRVEIWREADRVRQGSYRCTPGLEVVKE
ncbi:hypothetical protein [Thermoactinospora rubra]|uniref:hypothetical protein n=1 Tax=Thermoactinospora rubra TaxID=1088767 RepID=UPI00117D621E|nr:hypothetical protein [Thermoactinospora rubra]